MSSYRTYKRNKARKDQGKELAKLKAQLGTALIKQLGQQSKTNEETLITGYNRGLRQTSNTIHRQTVLEATFASTRHYKEQLSKAMKEIKRCQEELKELKARGSRKEVKESTKADETDRRKEKQGRKCESCGQLETPTSIHYK